MVSRRTKERRKYVFGSARKRAEAHESGFEPTSYKIPKGIDRFVFKKAGNYRIDVMPYITGKGNKFATEGQPHFERTFYVHPIGIDNRRYCCLRLTFKKPCPVCEHYAKAMNSGNADQDTLNALKPKERQLFIFKDASNDGDRDKTYIHECSHYKGFGEKLDDKVRSGEDGEYDHFWDPAKGMSLRVSTKDAKFAGRSYQEVTDIEFRERKEQYDTSIVEEMPCLDELLVETPYKEMKKIFLQTDTEDEEDEDERDETEDEEEDEDEEDEEEGDDEEEDEEEEDEIGITEGETAEELGIEVDSRVKHRKKEYTVSHVSRDGTSLRLKGSNGKELRGISPSDVTLLEAEDEEDEDEEEEEPQRNRKSRAKKAPVKKRKKEEEDEEWDEDDDDTLDEDDDED